MFAAAREKYGLAGHPENLAQVDGIYVALLKLWQDAGLLQSKPDGLLKHNAWEHMAAGLSYTEAIGQMLGLGDKVIAQLKEAYGKHDMDKDAESAVVKIATSDTVGIEAILQVLRNAHPIYESLETDARIGRMVRYDVFEDRILSQLRDKYADSMQPGVDVGKRIYVARDLIVGGWHDAKLAFEETDPEVIEMQAATEYSASPFVDSLLNDYANSDAQTQLSILKKVIIYVVDNAMRNTEFVDCGTRADEVFLKPANVLLSEAYANHSGTGETALEIQKRVGQRAVDFLAHLMGIQPEDFVNIVELRAQQNI